MENQHRKITGYRELAIDEIEAMNEIKALAEQAGALIESLQNRPVLHDYIGQGSGLSERRRWLAIGRTDLQTGFMALTRAIAQPTTF